MTREIKFRGYNKELGRWFYGDLFHAPDNRYFIRMWDENSSAFIDMIVENKSVGEFTGLKDKNGKEIYDGDIVKHRDIIAEKDDLCFISVNEDMHFCLRFLNKETDKIARLNGNYLRKNDCLEQMEVIGNIHENPELLKEEK